MKCDEILLKKGLKRLSLLLLIVLSLQLSVIPGTPKTSNNEQVSYNTWKLLNWNENITPEWYSQGKFINAQIGSLVTYNITSSQNNMTDPNAGIFSIGNATNISTDNYDLANTFIMSIYPWSPGFVTDPINWTLNEAAARNATTSGFLQGNLTITNLHSYNIAGYTRSAVQFSYSENLTNGNQNTTLIYDYSTGVLLFANTSIYFSSLFIMGLQLQSSTLITSSNVSTTSTPGFTIITVFAMILCIPILKKIKLKKFN